MAAQKILTREFVVNFLAQFAFSFVSFIFIPTLPIYLEKMESTGAEIGVLIGIFSLSSLIFRPFVGRALLRIPERNFMIAGTVIYTLSSIAYLFAKPFWPLLILRAFQGIGMTFFSTASLTLVTRLSPEAHRGKSIGYFYLAYNMAFVTAPYFGMFLINSFNFSILFLVCAFFSLCSFFISLKLEKAQGVPLEDESIQDQPFLSYEALPPSIMAFMASMMWGALSAFFPLYALSHGVANPGLFFAVIAIVLIFGRSLGGSIFEIKTREKVIFPCLAAQIIAVIVLTFSRTSPMFVLVAVIWGMGHAFIFPSLMNYALDRTSSATGPVIGTYTALSDFGAGMGPVIMGIILQLTGYTVMFLCLALTGLINLLYLYFILRRKGKGQYANL
jgi:predicted MFS family arabinose efflux permease